MNNIRKSIITILSDYMDKTLTTGCIVYLESFFKGYYTLLNDRDLIDFLKFSDRPRCMVKITEGQGGQLRNYFDECSNDNIIGHYDLSALLKYITNYARNYHITNDKIQWGDMGVDDFGNRYEYQTGEIPNKPLHLYTEQEEKDLLDLLLKLKNDLK